MRTSMVIVFLLLIAVIAAPFILKASRQLAGQLSKLWKEDVLDENPNQTEIEKGDNDVTH